MSQSGYLYTTSDLEKAFPLQLVDQFCAPIVYLEGQNVQSFQKSANVLVQKLFCFDMTEFQSLTSVSFMGCSQTFLYCQICRTLVRDMVV